MSIHGHVANLKGADVEPGSVLSPVVMRQGPSPSLQSSLAFVWRKKPREGSREKAGTALRPPGQKAWGVGGAALGARAECSHSRSAPSMKGCSLHPRYPGQLCALGGFPGSLLTKQFADLRDSVQCEGFVWGYVSWGHRADSSQEEERGEWAAFPRPEFRSRCHTPGSPWPLFPRFFPAPGSAAALSIALACPSSSRACLLGKQPLQKVGGTGGVVVRGWTEILKGEGAGREMR